jgi:outer membrane protein assembly factor BamB
LITLTTVNCYFILDAILFADNSQMKQIKDIFQSITAISVCLLLVASILATSSPNPANAALADSPWPMFQHDLKHTSQSPYNGAQSNSLQWSAELGAGTTYCPVIGSDGTVYIGCENGGNTFFAINPDGTTKWQRTIAGFSNTSAALSGDGTIYVPRNSGITALRSADGTPKWTYSFDPGEVYIYSNPAIAADGTIYIFGRYRLYALTDNGDTVSLKWKSAPLETYDENIGSSPAVGNDGTIYVGGRVYLHAFTDNGNSCTEKWYADMSTNFYASSPAIGSDGTIYVNTCNGALRAYTDAGTSAVEKWSAPFTGLGSSTASPAIASDGTIYVNSSTAPGAFFAVTDNGTAGVEKWSRHDTGYFYASPVIGADGTVYCGNAPDTFYAFNPADGTTKWSYAAAFGSRWGGAIGSNGSVYFGTYDHKLLSFNSRPVVSSVNPTSGFKGQTISNVVVTGRNFTGVTSVSFGAGITVGTFNVDTDTQITINSITIGSGAATGTRDITASSSTENGTLTAGFTIKQKFASIYVNGTTGNDSYDGSATTHTTGNTGPKKTIAGGIEAVTENGTVNVAAGTYHEHGLHLGFDMNMVGAGALTTIIDGDAAGNVIEVSSAPFQNNVISGFTIRNGAPAGSDSGGGIYISSSHIVTINDCAIVGNVRGPGSGPGPENIGGGICNDGGHLYLNRSTISGNSAGQSGGGLANLGSSPFGLMDISNCTIYGNMVTEANAAGGGIYTASGATTNLLNVTIAGNSAMGAGSYGGGFSNSSVESMYFKNCIVANNTAADSTHSNGFDATSTGLHSQGNNIDSQNSCNFNQSSDQRNTNPLLGALQNNGGQTSTMAITVASPAFNRGTNTGAPATDQRGIARPQLSTADIGAYELVAQQTVQVATATGTGTATLATSNGAISSFTASATLPCGSTVNGLSFPHGFLSFNINGLANGSVITMTITFPSNIPSNAQYWKCINGSWVNVTSLLGSNDGDNILTLTLTDGGLGDADGIANGTIIDPGGVGIPPNAAPAQKKPFADSSSSPTMPQALPAHFSVKYLNVQPQAALANQPVTIAANMANSGDEPAKYTATLKINGQVEQVKTGMVSGHTAQPITFTVSKSQPGTYSVDINGQQSSFTITGKGQSGSSTKIVIIMAIIVCVLGALLLAALVIRRRRAGY